MDRDPPKNLIPSVPPFNVTQGHRNRHRFIRRPDFKVTAYLKSNISKTVRIRDNVITKH